LYVVPADENQARQAGSDQFIRPSSGASLWRARGLSTERWLQKTFGLPAAGGVLTGTIIGKSFSITNCQLPITNRFDA
jgi:hypothetical protein